MKCKKIMLVTFLLLAILTMGAVSASEDISVEDACQDDVLAVEDAQEDLAENPIEEIIASDDEGEILADDSSNISMVFESEVDCGRGYDNIVYIYDKDSVNGTVTLSIDDKQSFNLEFDGSRNGREIYPSDLKDFNFEDYLGNHTVKVAYKDVTKQSVVSFVFEPYPLAPYMVGIGDSAYFFFKATSTSSGSVDVYNAVLDEETHNIEQTTFIGTYPISGSLSRVPLPAFTEKGNHFFAVNYTINGKNAGEFLVIGAVENSKLVTATISDTEIRPDDTVTFSITVPNSGYLDIFVDGICKNPGIEVDKGTVQRTFSNLTMGKHWIYIIYENTEVSNESYYKSFVFTVSKNIDVANVKLALSKTAFTYNAKVQKPTVTLTKGAALKQGVDYTLKWSSASPKKAG